MKKTKSASLMQLIAESKAFIEEDHLTPGAVITVKVDDDFKKASVIGVLENGNYSLELLDADGNATGELIERSDEELQSELNQTTINESSQYWLVKRSDPTEVVNGPYASKQDAERDRSTAPIGGQASIIVKGNYLGNNKLESYVIAESAATESGWYLVMANGKITGSKCASRSEAESLQKEAPVSTEVKFGTVNSNKEFIEQGT